MISSLSWLQLALPILTPIVIRVIKGYAPALPKAWLPILAPVLGAVAELIAYWSGVPSQDPVLSLVLGALGVWVREAIDQIKQATGLK